MGYTPFKMKGNPFQRNFGTGSPVKKNDEDKVEEVGNKAKETADELNWRRKTEKKYKDKAEKELHEENRPKREKKARKTLVKKFKKSVSKGTRIKRKVSDLAENVKAMPEKIDKGLDYVPFGDKIKTIRDKSGVIPKAFRRNK